MDKAQIIISSHKYIEKYHKLLKSRKGLPPKNVITVSAEIMDNFIVCMADHRGALHQHFFVNLIDVTEGDKTIVENKPVFVATRYGDKAGLKEPVPNLEPGNSIIIRGVYIPSDKAYKSGDNPGFPVLHFTHKPLGFIVYGGVTYE